MNTKKLQEYIRNLQKKADDNYAECTSAADKQAMSFSNEITLATSVEETNVNKDNNVALPQSIQPSLAEEYDNYFKTTLSSGALLNYGESFALSSGDFFTVEVDYIGLIASSGNPLKDISKCELCVWGKSRLAHCEYDIYTLKTGELLGSYSATHNLYYVDLKSLYDLYGDASFKFVAKWSGTESLSLDKISIRGKYLTNIKIGNPPDNISYTIGGTFNNTGLVVNACYSNGDVVAVDDYSVKPSTNLTRKDKFVTISYEDFSVVQPIQVISQKIGVTRKIQSRQRSDEADPWSDWEDLPTKTSEIYVSANSLKEIRAVLTIDKSKIALEDGEKSGIRLQMYCTKFPKPTEPTKHIKVNGVRVSKYPLYNFINAYIGDVKFGDEGDLEVVLEYDDYPFVINNQNNPPLIFFCEECDPATLVENKQIEVAEGSLNLNLCTGETRCEITDFNSEDNTLGCKISHILSPDNELNFYGRNFSLNICENLVLDAINTKSSNY